MKNIIIAITLLCLLSCNEKKSDVEVLNQDENNRIGIVAISSIEELSYEINIDPTTNYNIITVYGVNQNKYRKLAELKKLNNGNKVIIRDTNLYYTKFISDYMDETVKIFKYDSIEMIEAELPYKTGDTFSISKDQKYICFTKNDYKKETDWGTIYRPIVLVSDIKNNKTIEYDFSNTILHDIWGVAVSIDFNESLNSFYIEFSQDADANIGKINIFLDTLKYQNAN